MHELHDFFDKIKVQKFSQFK